jgi:hypothetical protein
MAYDATGLVTVAASKRGNAPSMYLYKTADAQAAVNTVGYFNSIASLLAVGDIIFVYSSASSGSLVLTYVNAVSAAGVVDIADGTTVDATDTD